MCFRTLKKVLKQIGTGVSGVRLAVGIVIGAPMEKEKGRGWGGGKGGARNKKDRKIEKTDWRVDEDNEEWWMEVRGGQ